VGSSDELNATVVIGTKPAFGEWQCQHTKLHPRLTSATLVDRCFSALLPEGHT
jgi:hypothetical protein